MGRTLRSSGDDRARNYTDEARRRNGGRMVAVTIRQAVPEDAAGMDAVLTPILERWGSARPRGAALVLSRYIADPDRLSCAVAEIAVGTRAGIVGFQSLKRASSGNPYDLPEGWGIIGTYVAAEAAGQGVGRALFDESMKFAQADGLIAIDATIGAENAEGLAYYAAMGFVDWRRLDGAVGKCFRLR